MTFYTAETQVFQVDPTNPDPKVIELAADVLRTGRLVAFPTETVYGLGANALDAAAIERIFSAKQRPAGDPVIAHIHNFGQLEMLAVCVPDIARTLAERFWPGPLTFVLYRAANVPANIAAGRDTIAVRMPAHPVARALLESAGVPIAAPSANTFSRPSATTAAHVLEDLRGRVDVVLDGGPATIGLESTVLDLTGAQPAILRPGGVVMGALRQVIPEVEFAPRYVAENETESSPGQMLKHYSPRAQVVLFRGTLSATLAIMSETAQKHLVAGRRVGVLVADEDACTFDSPVVTVRLGARRDLATISSNLFAGLRYLDSQQVDVILSRDFGQEGLGSALWDRLIRAAEGRVVMVD